MQKYIILFLFPVFAFAQMGTDLRLGKFDKIDSNSATEISILKELEALTTGAWKLPIGNTAARPAGAAGQIRYNSELLTFEGYTDAWGPIAGSGGLIVWEEALDLEVGDLVYRNDNKKIYRVITLHTTTSTFDEAKMIEIANSSSFSLLKNPDFENTIVEYACTDATAAFVDTTLPIYNNFKMFQMTVSVIGGYCDFTATTGAAMEGMLFRIGGEFQTSLAGVEYCTLVNGAVDNCIPIPSSATWKTPLATQSLAGATSVGIRIRSTTATGVVNADKLQLKIGGLPTGPSISCNGDLDCENVFSAYYDLSTAPQDMNVAGWISSITKSGTSNAIKTLHIPAGIFSEVPNCNVTGGNTVNIPASFYRKSASTITALEIVSGVDAAGTFFDREFSITCQKAAPDFKPITQQGAVNVGTSNAMELVVSSESITGANQTVGAATVTVDLPDTHRARGISWNGTTYEGTFLESGKVRLSANLMLLNAAQTEADWAVFPEIDKGSGYAIPAGVVAVRALTAASLSYQANPNAEFTFRVKSGDKVRLRVTSTGASSVLLGNTANRYQTMSIDSVVDQQALMLSRIDKKIYDGNEYLAGVVAVVGGVEKTVYRRCYELTTNIDTTTTIATIPTGLEPVEWVPLLRSNRGLYYGPEQAASGTNFSNISYNKTSGGVVCTIGDTTFSCNAGTRFCLKYTY